MRHKLILLSIIIFGLLLRALFINTSPPALYGDELTITLDAYSLLKTGHDELGNFLPLTFAMGAGRPAGYVYGSIPFVAVFGPGALGVRGLSILSGIGIIILLYLIGKNLAGEKAGLAAAIIAAVSPWDIALSRGGFEAHFALFLALLGIYFFLIAKQKPLFYIFSALCFGLTFHTYPTYKVSLLLFLPLLFWYQKGVKEICNKKYFFTGVVLLLVLSVLALSQTFVGGSETRFSDINIFSQSKLKNQIEQKIDFERQITEIPQFISRYFHNKPVEYTKVFIENYLQNFSLDFLVIHGDRNPRHNMATMGEVYAVELLLAVLGLLTFWPKDKRMILLLVLWFVLAPVPTAIVDLPHALRSAFMLPPLIVLSALGLSTLLASKNKTIIILIVFCFIIQFVFFVQKLFFLAPREYSNFWSYSARLASQLAVANQGKYNYIILSDKIDSIEFAYPVYAKADPLLVISQNKNKAELKQHQFKKLNNVYIGYLPETEVDKFLNSLDGSALYIGSAQGAKDLQNYQTINGLDDATALAVKQKGL